MKVLITGGTNGMGKGVAKILAGNNNQIHEVIILGRSREHGEAAIMEIEESTGNMKSSFVLCDLSKLSDVRIAINEIHKHHKHLDGLFINAGLGYAAKREETEDGMDPHFQVNYLSQFMLTLNVLDLLENSKNGGRVIYNVTKGGKVFWDDLQLKNKWSYVKCIHQGMVLKRMLSVCLHNIYRENYDSKVSFFGFQISKTVWSNQINIIPTSMKTMAKIMKFFGGFISIEKCGLIMSALFTEDREKSLQKSGKFITWKKNKFTELKEETFVFDKELQANLWRISIDLCKDEKTAQIAKKLTSRK